MGVEGAKYVSPHPREPILLDITILGTRTDFDCISLRNRSRVQFVWWLPIVSRQEPVNVPVFNIK